MSLNPDGSAARHDGTADDAGRVAGDGAAAAEAAGESASAASEKHATGTVGGPAAAPASGTIDADAAVAPPAPAVPDASPSDALPAPAEAPTPEEQTTVTEASVRVQRSPRYFRFMLTGAVLFAVVALVLTFAFPENPTYDRGSVFGFLLAVGVAIGVGVGAVVALLVDRAVTRRARTVRADRIDVRVGDGSEDSRPAADS